MKKGYTVLYQAKSSNDGVYFNYSWEVWKKNLPTLEAAEAEKQICARIFGRPVRIV